jgi:lipoyl(octanoyl) transferase
MLVNSLVTLRLGIISYNDALELQEDLHSKIVAKQSLPHLLLCQHPPVITYGSSSEDSHMLTSPDQLPSLGIDLVKTNRGGKITYHGLGQIMAYPLLDLREGRRDISWYMRCLEEVIIMTLYSYGIQGERSVGQAGVWIQPPLKKIASMGVRVRHWCTLHGFALNVFNEEPSGFSHINPCGFSDVEMTSIETEMEKNFCVTLDDVMNKIEASFRIVAETNSLYDKKQTIYQ